MLKPPRRDWIDKSGNGRYVSVAPGELGDGKDLDQRFSRQNKAREGVSVQPAGVLNHRLLKESVDPLLLSLESEFAEMPENINRTFACVIL
jgi:hypothetical protein